MHSIKGPFIIYGQWGGDFEGGTFLTSRRWGAHIFGKFPMGATFLEEPIFKKPAKPKFLLVLGKNKT